MSLPAFGTHMPALLGALLRSSGNIIELGCGFFSTSLTHAFAVAQNRKTFSVDTSLEYFTYVKRYESENHKILHIDGFMRDASGKFFSLPNVDIDHYISVQRQFLDDLFESLQHQKFSVAFVDQDPAFLRQPAIEWLSDKADFIIVHDTESIGHYKFDFSSYKYWYEDFSQSVRTVCVSNFFPCDFISDFYWAGSRIDDKPLLITSGSRSSKITPLTDNVILNSENNIWSSVEFQLHNVSQKNFINLSIDYLDGQFSLGSEFQIRFLSSENSDCYLWSSFIKDGKSVSHRFIQNKIFIYVTEFGHVGNIQLNSLDILELRFRSKDKCSLEIKPCTPHRK